jgi:hypothetical protein
MELLSGPIDKIKKESRTLTEKSGSQKEREREREKWFRIETFLEFKSPIRRNLGTPFTSATRVLACW